MEPKDYCDAMIMNRCREEARRFVARLPVGEGNDKVALWSNGRESLVGWIDDDMVCAQFHPRVGSDKRPLDAERSISPEIYFGGDVACIEEASWSILQAAWSDGLLLGRAAEAEQAIQIVIFLMTAPRCRYCGTMLTAADARAQAKASGRAAHCVDHKIVVDQLDAFAKSAAWPPKESK